MSAGDNQDLTPLHEACYNGDLKTVKNLLRRNPDIDAVARSGVGRKPLDVAKELGYDDVQNCLIKYAKDGKVGLCSIL